MAASSMACILVSTVRTTLLRYYSVWRKLFQMYGKTFQVESDRTWRTTVITQETLSWGICRKSTPKRKTTPLVYFFALAHPYDSGFIILIRRDYCGQFGTPNNQVACKNKRASPNPGCQLRMWVPLRIFTSREGLAPYTSFQTMSIAKTNDSSDDGGKV